MSTYVSPLTPDRGRRSPGVAHPVTLTIPTPTPSSAASDEPPSYSATERIGLPITNSSSAFHVVMGHRGDVHRAPFYHRTPPPSYSESELNSGGDVQHQSYATACLPVLWSRRPRFATCPACGTRSITEVQLVCSRNTHLAALALCLCGCWPFCLLPYAAPACKAAHHHCRRCHFLIGVYDPWSQQW